MNKRISFFLVFLALMAVEILIALFVHDDFVRPYVGDAIVVIVIYCLIRTIIPNGVSLLSLYIFLFSVLVEVLQYYDIVTVLGLGDNEFMRILIGTSFSWWDIACYAVGCAITGIWEFMRIKKRP